jgi:tetratricopeptide (TPR) repeat protein
MKSLAFYLPVTLLAASIAHGQQNQTTDLIPALKKQCGIIKMALERQGPDTEGSYKAAATLCAHLEAPAGSSDADAEARTARDLYQILARMNLPPATAADRFAALESAASAKDGLERFYALVDLAKVAFEAGHLDKATAYAQELLQMAPQFPKNWNYGNALYYGHFVLGRVALREGNTKEAASQLVGAGTTPGSPQLNSFGPDVTLAQDLLAQGQAQPVLEYLAECKSFWKLNRGKLDEWIGAIRAGGTPDFGSNLMSETGGVTATAQARTQLNEGVQAFKNAQYPEAVEHFKTAVELDPTFDTAQLYLAFAYMQQYIPGAESPENMQIAAVAHDQFQKVLAQNPKNELAIASIASLLFNEKKLDDASQWYLKLIQLNPKNKEAFYTLGVIAWTKALVADGEARAKLGMKPDDPGPLKDKKVRAAVAEKNGPIIDDGIKNLDRSLQIDPEYDDAMAYENLLYRQKADLEETAEAYKADIDKADDYFQKTLETRKIKAERKPSQKLP